jgi:hypothetical protein
MAKVSSYEGVLSAGSEELSVAQVDFERTGAADYIVGLRQPNDMDSPIDWQATLAALNAGVLYAPLSSSGMISGSKYCPQIWIDSRDPVCRQQITIGHEVGHFFWEYEAGMQPSWAIGSPEHARQEIFCDYFSHRLIGRPACLAMGLEIVRNL